MEPLDNKLTHPHLCRVGPARMRPHRGLCHVLCQEIKFAGTHVDLERACPEFYKISETGAVEEEAILDVVIHFPGGPQQRMVDFTIRCPHASSYANCDKVTASAASSGAAASGEPPRPRLEKPRGR